MKSGNKETIRGDSVEVILRENFRLSGYEARSYLALLRQGKQNPRQLSNSAGIPLPRVYDTLESLMSKGFALKNDDETHSAIPPKLALKGRASQFEIQFAQEQKQRKILEEELASFLEHSMKEESSEAKSSGEISILKGFNSIANKFSELLEISDEVILMAKRAMEAREAFIPILSEIAMKGSRKRKKIRIIVPSKSGITKDEVRLARNARAEIRKSDHILFDMMVTNTDDVIIGVPDPLSEEINHAIGIWVRNSSFAKSTRNAVEEIWKSAERI